MKIHFLLLFIFAFIHSQAQSPCPTNPKFSQIRVLDKTSVSVKDVINNTVSRTIKLTRDEFKNLQKIESTCDSLKVVEYTYSIGCNGADVEKKVYGNSIPNDVRNSVSKCINQNHFFELIKVQGKSGIIYKLVDVNVVIIPDPQ